MQRDRRRDPYPWTWEIPALAVVVTILVTALGVQTGRAVANLLVGGEWHWPAATTTTIGPSSPLGASFWGSIPAVLTGRSDAGLNPVPAETAGRVLTWMSVGLVELVFLGALTWGCALLLRHRGPNRVLGVASASEAEALLGRTRIRKAAPIIRPDLYGSHPDLGQVSRTAGPDPYAHDLELGRGMSVWQQLVRRTEGDNP